MRDRRQLNNTTNGQIDRGGSVWTGASTLMMLCANDNKANKRCAAESLHWRWCGNGIATAVTICSVICAGCNWSV
jgi:hypothetical protein